MIYQWQHFDLGGRWWWWWGGWGKPGLWQSVEEGGHSQQIASSSAHSGQSDKS